MIVTKKSVKKSNVKKSGCPCGCACDKSCECCNDSVKYTGIWAAWRAFWRRGYTEWAGTSSRSEYWLSCVGNLIVFILGGLLVCAFAGLESVLVGHPAVLTIISGVVLISYIIAWIIPEISMLTRRMHDAGLSAWVWLVYLGGIIPMWNGEMWVDVAPEIGLILALLPTQVHANKYHKFNK